MSSDAGRLTVLVVATSYPRASDDWQGLFIRKLVAAMGADPRLCVRLWSPPGPLPSAVASASGGDADFLASLAGRGGIAHLLRRRPSAGLPAALSLLRRLRRLYLSEDENTVLHINWLQNALPLVGLERKAVISVLGSDYALLRLPGMVRALRRVLRSNRCVIAPNAAWMVPELERRFGDVAPVQAVNFGIDEHWYAIPLSPRNCDLWVCVSRITRDKMGPLFDWGRGIFGPDNPLHLMGPMQEKLDIPDWVIRHEAVPAELLESTWFPRAHALLSLSRHSEGRPQVMLEAMAAGLPIVATPLPAHTETVAHGKTGYLVDSRSALEAAVSGLADTQRRHAMGAAARDAMRAHFGTWSDCRQRYQALYARL